MKSILIPESVTELGSYSFSSCKSLTSVVLPESIDYVPIRCFSGCTSLATITIPKSITTIGASAFEGCSSLTSVVFLTKELMFIGDNAFTDCTSLKSIQLMESIKGIGSQAFKNCTSLESAVIPQQITEIEEEAYYGCTNLRHLTLPERLKEIGRNAFVNCGLHEIVSLNTTPPHISIGGFDGVSVFDCIVKVPEEAIDTYMGSKWSMFRIEGYDGTGGGGGTEEPSIPEVCEKPVISITDGKLTATSATPGAECNISITSEDCRNYDGNEPIELSGVYNITAYAHAEGYQNSPVAKAVIIWLNPTLGSDTEAETRSDSRTILISNTDSAILVSGTERGEHIAVYLTDGTLAGTAMAQQEETIVPLHLERGKMYIVRIGGRSFKYMF